MAEDGTVADDTGPGRQVRLLRLHLDDQGRRELTSALAALLEEARRIEVQSADRGDDAPHDATYSSTLSIACFDEVRS